MILAGNALRIVPKSLFEAVQFGARGRRGGLQASAGGAIGGRE